MSLTEIFENQETYVANQKIQKSIRKIAMDPTMPVKNAVALVRQAYTENGLQVPSLYSDKDYKNYEAMCLFAVNTLHKAMVKGLRDDSWKYTPNDVPIA